MYVYIYIYRYIDFHTTFNFLSNPKTTSEDIEDEGIQEC